MMKIINKVVVPKPRRRLIMREVARIKDRQRELKKEWEVLNAKVKELMLKADGIVVID